LAALRRLNHFSLASLYFVLQSNFMKTNWAEENLQTIRTLMERSAVYRRALAPIMIFAGVLGSVAAVIGLFFHLGATLAFGLLWLATASVVVIGAFVITRQQALKDKEIFWSAPTRRVAQALLPPLIAGMCVGVLMTLYTPGARSGINSIMVLLWLFFYGCALHSAGFFMPRGIRLFGWIYIILACGCSFLIFGELKVTFSIFYSSDNANWLMGFFFGVLHLAYGAYLFLTEKKNPDA
jgi:hypothetical protein